MAGSLGPRNRRRPARHVSDSPSQILLQAMNHSTEHRSQVFTFLTPRGVEPARDGRLDVLLRQPPARGDLAPLTGRGR